MQDTMQDNEVGEIYNLNVPLPESVSSILNRDIWIFDDFNAEMLKDLRNPVTFSAFTSIYLKRGSIVAELNLKRIEISAPCIINIRADEILNPIELSDDLSASCTVISKDLSERIFNFIRNSSIATVILRNNIIKVSDDIEPAFVLLYSNIKRIISDKSNSYLQEALSHAILAFFFTYIIKYYQSMIEGLPSSYGRLTDKFISLVQENFREQRFLEFYANSLEITPKHLSRTVKQQTGFTAVEWIDRFVILEAKSLLKSSTLNIQQIADRLNFPSQSFFGKYFKHHAGQSPKDFRNSTNNPE